MPNPISLALVTGKEHELSNLRDALFRFLEFRYDQLKRDKILVKDYYMDNLLGLNVPGTFQIGEETKQGTIINIDDSGRLVISFNGKKESFNHGAVAQIID